MTTKNQTKKRKTTTAAKTAAEPNASVLVKQLIAAGKSTEAIAAELEVSNNSILRWRDGQVTPHRSHITRLAALVMKVKAEKRADRLIPRVAIP